VQIKIVHKSHSKSRKSSLLRLLSLAFAFWDGIGLGTVALVSWPC